MKKLIFTFLSLVISFTAAQATHLKGGKITYEHLSGRTYKITLTGYSEGTGHDFRTGAEIDFGDGQVEAIIQDGSVEGTLIGEHTRRFEFEFIHTYSSAGRYLVKYQELFRNGGVLNMENSSNMPFHIEAYIVVDAFIPNKGLKLLQDPSHTAYINQTYHYNPQAYDPDGDSLSFHLAIPKQAEDEPVTAYTFPHKTFNTDGGSETGENAYLTLDPKTGDLVWDAPVRAGEYHLAIEVREWREIEGEYLKIGSVVLDMQIVVESSPVDGLELVFPGASQEIYLDAGSPWETTIRATASNPEDTVVLEIAGNFMLQSPELNPSDSTGGKGEVAITLEYNPSVSGLKRHQFIASAYIYSTEKGSGPFRSRAVYLLSPGYISGITDLPVKDTHIFPNPVVDGRFYVNDPLLDGKKVHVSLFSAEGKLVYQKTIPAFSHKEPIQPAIKAKGIYQLLIQEGSNLYAFRILFNL